MLGNRFWLSLLVLIGLLIAPPLASSAPFKSKELLDESALVDTSAFSAYVVTGKNVDHLYCEFDLTAISGGGGVTMQIVACNPAEIEADGCVNASDGSIWYQGASLTSTGNERLMVMAAAPVGDEATMTDIEIVGPVPAVWAIVMPETGSTTLTYTVTCQWW